MPGRPPLERSLPERILRSLGRTALGIQTHRRRAQWCRHPGFGDFRAQGVARGRSPAGATANEFIVASVLAIAGGEHGRVRFPHGQDHLPAADLCPLLYFALDPADRIRRLQLQSGRTLGHAAGAQPRHAARRRAPLPVPHPRRPRPERERLRRAVGAHRSRTASTGSSSWAAAISSTCSASTACTTTSTGHTARFVSYHPTADPAAATQRR